MHSATTPGKSSTDSSNTQVGLDRWSQRRLQRLNTEHIFREQRQGQQQQQAQPHPSQQQQQASTAYHAAQSNSQNNLHSPYAASSPPSSSSAASPGVYIPTHQQQYSPPEQNNHSYRQLQQSRSFTQTQPLDDTAASTPTDLQSKPRSANRQSVHNTNMSAPSANNPVSSPMPPTTTTQTKDVGRSTPQLSGSDDMSQEDVDQLIKDHKELREKYTKVKKYYFEKEDQVKSLQNSLAHQRISQSRTSLDDSEYSTRFSRLDGLIAQLSFSIRKSWKSVPPWLAVSINKDAILTGKQEMTAAGRAIISQWLVEEVFDKYFHPDIDMVLSSQLKDMQKNIRRFAPPPQSHEDEEFLISKVVNWRLTTLEGLQEILRSPDAPDNRAQLTELLKHQLMTTLQNHLDNPPMSDLDGGVHMIIELAVAMASHLPLESRDVQIEYFPPGTPLNPDSMKPETGIPALNSSLADELAERASLRSANSDITDATEKSTLNDGAGHTKRGMLSALTGGGKKREPAQGRHAAAGGSNSSLGRPDTAATTKDENRVRMAVGIAAHVRGRTVLVKAPIFMT